MVGVDLLAQADVFLLIHTQGRGDAPNRLGECDRRTPVQNTHRLVCSWGDRHGGAEKIGPDFCHAYIDGICQRFPGIFSQLLDGSLGAPNAHGA